MNMIAFTGAQGTGKTTMRGKVAEYLRNDDMYVLENYVGVNESVSRDAAQLGFEINLEADFESQYYMTASYITADLRTRMFAKKHNVDYVLVDRSILDILPYAKMCKQISNSQYLELERMVLNHLMVYWPNSLVYCKMLDVLVPDVNRSGDAEYQKVIDGYVQDNLRIPVSLGVKPLYLEAGSIDERLKVIVEKLGFWT